MGWFDNPFEELQKEVDKIGKSIEKGVQDLGKNIETNYQNAFTNLGMLAAGKWDNLGQTLLNTGLSLTGVTNPDTVYSLSGETNVQRAKREATEKAAMDELEANAAKERERLSGLANMLSSSAAARRMAPGMSQTLLGSGTTSNPLITVK